MAHSLLRVEMRAWWTSTLGLYRDYLQLQLLVAPPVRQCSSTHATLGTLRTTARTRHSVSLICWLRTHNSIQTDALHEITIAGSQPAAGTAEWSIAPLKDCNCRSLLAILIGSHTNPVIDVHR